jgi:hypothetical protein
MLVGTTTTCNMRAPRGTSYSPHGRPLLVSPRQQWPNAARVSSAVRRPARRGCLLVTFASPREITIITPEGYQHKLEVNCNGDAWTVGDLRRAIAARMNKNPSEVRPPLSATQHILRFLVSAGAQILATATLAYSVEVIWLFCNIPASALASLERRPPQTPKQRACLKSHKKMATLLFNSSDCNW